MRVLVAVGLAVGVVVGVVVVVIEWATTSDSCEPPLPPTGTVVAGAGATVLFVVAGAAVVGPGVVVAAGATVVGVLAVAPSLEVP